MSSCASAISSTFDRRVGRRYVDGVTVLVCGNGGIAAGGDLVTVVVAVAARDTCERDPVDGDSAHNDDDDWEALEAVPFFSGWYGCCCLDLRPRTVAIIEPFTSFNPRALADATSKSKSFAESI
jgi:hypothetical protein